MSPLLWDISDYFTLEGMTDTLSRNVGNYQATLCDISEERRPRLHRDGSLKSRAIYHLRFI